MFMRYALTLRNYSTVCIPEITCRGISPLEFSLFCMLAYILNNRQNLGIIFFNINVILYMEIHKKDVLTGISQTL